MCLVLIRLLPPLLSTALKKEFFKGVLRYCISNSRYIYINETLQGYQKREKKKVRKNEHKEEKFYDNCAYVKHLHFMLNIAKLKAQFAKIDNKIA